MTRIFWRRYFGKRQIDSVDSGLAWSVLLLTMIFVVTVSKFVADSRDTHFNHCDDAYRLIFA